MTSTIITIIIALSSLLTPHNTASHVPTTPQMIPCIAPPSNATKAEIECFTAACDAYSAAWNECQTAQCRSAARAEHVLAVNACLTPASQHQLFIAPQSDRESDPWMTIWISNDGAGYALGYDEPAGELVLRF